jgi:hypothetical protein
MDVDGIMKAWPRAWMGVKEDRVFGEKLIVELKPFVEFLVSKKYAKRTLDRHLEHLFLMGGEIIRAVSIDEDYDADPGEVLRSSVEEEGGPLCRHLHTEEQQRAYDATCRKLHKFFRDRYSK